MATAPWADKMNQIFALWFIDHVCTVKMAGDWLCSLLRDFDLDSVLLHKHSIKKNFGQYPAMLTSRLLKNRHYPDFHKLFWTLRGVNSPKTLSPKRQQGGQTRVQHVHVLVTHWKRNPRKFNCTAPQLIPRPEMIPKLGCKWSPMWIANGPGGKRGMAWSLVSWIFIYFHQLNDESVKIKRKIYWQRKLYLNVIHVTNLFPFSLNNSSKELRGKKSKLVNSNTVWYFSTSSIYSNNSLMLP